MASQLRCPKCGYEERLLSVTPERASQGSGVLSFPCPECGEKVEVYVLPEQYTDEDLGPDE
jgi:predicted RNA-binding Zn-ribbon protein involved in translation (DUF1610 family)